MSSTVLLVKNMVCNRCILAVENILNSEYIPFQRVRFGEIAMMEKPHADQYERLAKRLQGIGFELILNSREALIEKVKQLVIQRVRNEVGVQESQMKLSHYLASKVNHEYTYLSSLFSAEEGRTIEHYLIQQRIENAKELLAYGQLSLSQIAFDLHYSSTAHLSAQFKKITGLTPTHYRESGIEMRRSLDKI